MCKVMEDMRNETALAKALEIARSLVSDSEMSDEQIAKHTGIPISQVTELRNELLQPA